MIVDAGFLLQLDDARAAVTYDRMVPPAGFADYRKWVDMHMEVLNHAIEGLPPDRIRYHVCWGSWPGPHITRRSTQRHRRSHLEGEGRGLCDRRRQSAPRARVEGMEGCQAAGRQGADPRRHQPRHQRGGASRTGCRNGSAVTPGSSGARTCWRERIVASRRARSTAGSIRRSCGQNSTRWHKARALPAGSCGTDDRPELSASLRQDPIDAEAARPGHEQE